MSDYEDFWCYLLTTLYIEAIAFAALAAAVRFEEIENAMCLMYTIL